MNAIVDLMQSGTNVPVMHCSPIINGDLSGNGFWSRRPTAVQVLAKLVFAPEKDDFGMSCNFCLWFVEKLNLHLYLWF